MSSRTPSPALSLSHAPPPLASPVPSATRHPILPLHVRLALPRKMQGASWRQQERLEERLTDLEARNRDLLEQLQLAKDQLASHHRAGGMGVPSAESEALLRMQVWQRRHPLPARVPSCPLPSSPPPFLSIPLASASSAFPHHLSLCLSACLSFFPLPLAGSPVQVEGEECRAGGRAGQGARPAEQDQGRGEDGEAGRQAGEGEKRDLVFSRLVSHPCTLTHPPTHPLTRLYGRWWT